MGFVRKIGREIDDAIFQPIKEVVEDVVDVVKEVGRDFDDFVRDTIPGGWAGVAGGALLAVGIYNPTLFGLAEAGALSGEALAAAGLDAAAVAEGVAAIAPEVLAATEVAVSSGLAPEIIAMANATLDPIAALNAAQGFTIADTAYLASIGAPEALIATAVTNNAAFAAAEAAAAETAATTGATEGAATGATEGGATTGAADGSTTQIFDDGSTLTTNADGSITSVGTDGVTQTTQIFDDGSTLTTGADGNVVSSTNATDTGLTGGTGGSTVPVEDAVSVPGAGAGTPDPTLGSALKNYAGAVYDSLGPLGTAGLLGGGAALLGGLTGGGSATGPGGGTASYEWGQAQPLVNPGLNPGYLGYAASMPDYQSTNPTDAQYYWGVNAPVNTQEQLANYNKLPDYAPATPWGAGKTAVGGQARLDPNQFVNQYITNPAYAGVNNAAGPGFAPPTGAVAPAMQPAVMPPMSMAQQAIAARTSGAPAGLSLPGPVVPV